MKPSDEPHSPPPRELPWSGGRPPLEVDFVAVCDAVLRALKGERRSPLPTSPSGSASARLTQNQAAEMSSPDSSVGVRFTQYRAPSIPGEFTSAGQTRISSGIRYPYPPITKGAAPKPARSNESPCIMATTSPDEWSVGPPKSEPYSQLSRSKHSRHRPLVRCVNLHLKSTLIPFYLPPLAAVLGRLFS